jgi:hypothetical protein
LFYRFFEAASANIVIFLITFAYEIPADWEEVPAVCPFVHNWLRKQRKV